MCSCSCSPPKKGSSWNTGNFGIRCERGADPSSRSRNPKNKLHTLVAGALQQELSAAGDSDSSEVGSLDANRKISVVCSYCLTGMMGESKTG